MLLLLLMMLWICVCKIYKTYSYKNSQDINQVLNKLTVNPNNIATSRKRFKESNTNRKTREFNRKRDITLHIFLKMHHTEI